MRWTRYSVFLGPAILAFLTLSPAVAAERPATHASKAVSEETPHYYLRCQHPEQETTYWRGYCEGMHAGAAAGKRDAENCLPRSGPPFFRPDEYGQGWIYGYTQEYDSVYKRWLNPANCRHHTSPLARPFNPNVVRDTSPPLH
ncbi:hypothetical protein ACFVYE_09230 [Streptomyces sp. NPDC058239]|uniref:hypothetical protein n=1 Tax=unclassified Streptomyces TaxID=2593676 RepID=UPI003666CBC7